MIRIKRTYETSARGDGRRILVERLWPRGMKKEDLRADVWMKDVAPSTELRQWFGHRVERWDEFQARYATELQAAEKQALLHQLAAAARQKTVTLVFAARDTQHNSAVVPKQILEQQYLG